MDLLQMLNDNQHLQWGDPDNPDDDDAVVYLCSAAADEITTLRARLDSARVLLRDNGVRFYWRRVRSLAQQHDGDDRQLYLQVPTNLRELLNKFVDDSDTWLAEDGNDAGASVRPADLEE